MVDQKVAARLQLGPNCLLFFIDETGHETFADKNYPVFGLGGCAINSSSAAAVIAEPWRAMKAGISAVKMSRCMPMNFVEIGCAADWQDAVRNHYRFDDEPVHGFAEARFARAERGGIPA